MKHSTKLSDAVHILLFIYLNPVNDLSSNAIAQSICTHPSYVRQIMSKLRKAKIIDSSQGLAKPMITESLDKISLCKVYSAVENKKSFLYLDTKINPDCIVGVNIMLALSDYYNLVQESAETKMKNITLQNILDTYYQKLKKGGI